MTISPVKIRLENENPVLQEELGRVQLELRRIDQLKRDFVALSAHELRAPLAVLLGYAKILESETTGLSHERASIIATQAWHLKELVDAIIMLQQIDAGEISLHMEPIAVHQLVQDVINEHQKEIAARSLALRIRTPPDLHVYADRERLALVLSHLLANSIKFSPPNKMLEISANTDITCAVIGIRDEGLGIPDDEKPHIFDRFYQIGDALTRHHNGLGLGLAVAKELVELHHGRIWVESMPQGGSTFYFSMPRIIGNPGLD